MRRRSSNDPFQTFANFAKGIEKWAPVVSVVSGLTAVGTLGAMFLVPMSAGAILACVIILWISIPLGLASTGAIFWAKFMNSMF